MPTRRIVALPILLLLFSGLVTPVFGQLNPNDHIHVDQFGYHPDAAKLAVISDPQIGFNAAQSFQPGSTYEVRKWPSHEVVMTGSPTPWNNGATHSQSGDKGWWLDFSSVNDIGSFYVYDVQNQVSSHLFEIRPDVYQVVLEQAVRTFFYQRINFAKSSPYADQFWTDAAAFEGSNQDRAATSRWAKGDASTARDLHGGWMDAGDYNKYTTFARDPVMHLLQAYYRQPTVFTDETNIPESGNGIPDLLDEVMWELDWLKRMQDGTGTNGFFLKLGVDVYTGYTPPSTDPNPRYYLPECTSATLAGAAMFAYAAMVLDTIPALSSYASDLQNRAALAWARGKAETQDFTTFEQDCDDGDIKAGDADQDASFQLECGFIAAVYLYQLTGDSQYLTFAESKYQQVRPYSENWWGPYNTPSAEALLFLADLPDVSSNVANNIRSSKAGMNYQYSIDDHQAGTGLYLGFLEDWAHHWGSNQIRANAGNGNLSFIEYGINPAQADLYEDAALGYLHWLHGVNPLGLCMLSNMYDYGGDHCVNELYHGWFKDGSDWDNALTSPKGPPPGYLTGGPNIDFSLGATISPPGNQPAAKSYKDWNADWPENSWEITEPAIYYQAAYILLLSRLMDPDTASTTSINESQRFHPLVISPNPASNSVTVHIPSPLTNGTCHLLDLQGKLIKAWTIERNTPTQELLLKGVTDGVYVLRYSDGEEVHSVKFLVNGNQ